MYVCMYVCIIILVIREGKNYLILNYAGVGNSCFHPSQCYKLVLSLKSDQMELIDFTKYQ